MRGTSTMACVPRQTSRSPHLRPWAGAAARRLLLHPARITPAAYLLGWVLGTLLLHLPWCSTTGNTTWWQAAFTAMSALCITGLATVDTATHWSTAGQLVILGLIQVGGLGIMTLASMVVFSLTGRVSPLAARVAQAETRSGLREIGRLPLRILGFSLACQGLVALVLALRFWMLDRGAAEAVYHGVFHAVSAFNNAGFALFSDNLVRFNADPWVMLPVCASVIVGGLGFPVWTEVYERLRGRSVGRIWSVHLRLTVGTTAVLLIGGFLCVALFEWNNPMTLGSQGLGGKLLGALGGTVFPRTAGFNSIDYGHVSGATLLVTDGLMLVGGGSAGTAGGLKVTTAAVLVVTVVAEVTGESTTVVGGRRISVPGIRQALAVSVLGALVVFLGLLVMTTAEPHSPDQLTFEAISAFGTAGLSTGITPVLSHTSWGVLIVLMFLGRVGPVSAAAALALHGQPRHFRYPEEDPLVG